MAKRKPRAKARRKKSSPPKSTLATRAQCAAALHLGERRINQLAAEGLPKSAHGRYDLDRCLRWYVKYLQKKLRDAALPDPEGGHTASIALRHKILSVESELKQLDLAKVRRQLITVDRVNKDFASIVLEIKRRFLEAAPRLAAEVIGEKDLVTITDKIDRSLKDVLVQLSKFDP